MANKGRTKRVRTYRWYVQPDDSHTNKTIANGLGNFGLYCEVAEGEQLVKGASTPMYEVTRGFINCLRKSRFSLGLSFTVFVQQGNGEIRPWCFM